MSKVGRKKKRDSDVLRAGDIVPPYGDEGDTKAAARKKKNRVKKPTASRKAGGARGKRKTAKSAAVGRQGRDIPQLDLDKQILAKQRKVTSVRRKGPGAKSVSPAKATDVASPGRKLGRAVPALSEQDQIIAQIVAKDIERLCGR